MPSFSYKARTLEGQVVSGVLTAENQPAALRQLDERALFPVQVREGGQAEKAAVPGIRRSVSARALASFYGQFADLLRAGVPVLRGLELLAKQSSSPLLKEVVLEVREDVSAGDALAEAMGKHPRVFVELQTAMIRAGETGGFLEDVLTRIAKFTEHQNELRGKLIGSLIYPCILLTAGMGVVIFVMSFVVPKIRPFLTGGGRELPLLTKFVFGLCDVLAVYGVFMAAGLVMLILAVRPYLASEQGRRQIDRLKLKVPLLGNIVTMVSVCQFCRILGTLLHSGVPMLAALRVAKESAGNVVLRDEIERATENVSRGETLSEPLGASGLFPPDIIDMLAIAEESNNLEQVLIQIADTNEIRTARSIDIAVRIMEPLLLMAMAGMVLMIALALLVPILTISSGIG
jgi:general secretion pathway protein F/type IV pilus assembly protein PilC